MPRNIQQAWSGPTVFAVDPPSAVVDGTLDVSGTPGIETLVAGGVLAGGTISPPGGTISLSIGAGLSNPAPGTIANSGVLAIAQGTLSATGTVTAGSGLTLTGTTLTATGGVTEVVAGAGLTTNVTSTNGTITTTGTLSTIETVNAQTGTSYAIQSSDRGKLITVSNTAAIALTIAQAGTAFPAGWWADIQNIGAGLATLAPTTSTIEGLTAYRLMTGFGGRIISDGTNYLVQNSAALYALASSAISNWLPGIPTAAAGGNARGANALDIQAVRTVATRVASGQSAVTLGNEATGSATSAVAVGSNVGATQTEAAAFGNGGVLASGTASLALGRAGTASGTNAIVAGNGSVATGLNTHAIGAAVSNLGTNSFGQGASIDISGANSFVTGLLGDDRSNGHARIYSPSSLGSTTSKGRSQVEDYVLTRIGGVNATATAVLSGGHVTSATLTNVGSGYSISQAVTITGDGAGAAATTVINNGTILSISFSNTGSLYTTATITIPPPILRLTAGNAASPSAANTAGLGSASAQIFDLRIIVADISSGEYATFYMATPGAIGRPSNAASTAMSASNPAITAGPASASPPGLGTPTITADTTLGSYDISIPVNAGGTATLYAEAHLDITNLRWN